MHCAVQPTIIEPYPVPDILATGFMCEEIGGLVRVTAYVDRPSFMVPGELERIIVARIVYAATDFKREIIKVRHMEPELLNVAGMVMAH